MGSTIHNSYKMAIIFPHSKRLLIPMVITSAEKSLSILRKLLAPTFALGLFLCSSMAYAADPRSIGIDCGEAHATIQCTPGSTDCNSTSLHLQATGGASPKSLSKPLGMESYTAVGLVCARAQDGTPYLLVQFGERPDGCNFCEWLHVYSLEGRALTRSQPPILRDKSRPDQSALLPNNADFERLSKKLGLERPKFKFLE